MFNRMLPVLISLSLILCLAFPVCAETALVVDEASLLMPEEIAILEEKAAGLEQSYGIQAVILTVDSLGGNTAQDFTDDFYDQGGYGENGVLFLLSMAEREWYISTCGTVIYALTDYGVQQLGERVVPFLSEELWFEGFACFLDSLPTFLEALESGSPVDGFADESGAYYHGEQEEILYYEQESSPSFLLSLIYGAVISGIAILVMRRSMNTKRTQRCAGEYVKSGSWNLTHNSDIFLYSNVTKTRKQDPPKNTGGGSSVHRSSSGRRHGGGGGKF